MSVPIGSARAALLQGQRFMGSYYGTMIVIVSVITFVILSLLFVRDNYWNKTWGQVAKPVTLQEVFRDWIAYVLMFTTHSLVLRALLCVVCSHCESC